MSAFNVITTIIRGGLYDSSSSSSKYHLGYFLGNGDTYEICVRITIFSFVKDTIVVSLNERFRRFDISENVMSCLPVEYKILLN